jgi:hypothetical protein
MTCVLGLVQHLLSGSIYLLAGILFAINNQSLRRVTFDTKDV